MLNDLEINDSYPIMAHANKSPFSASSPRSITVRKPPYSYLHLALISASTLPHVLPAKSRKVQSDMDLLTAQSYVGSALKQYLGLTGSTIPIDFLRIEGMDCWIRIPRQDEMMVVGALGHWISSREGGVAWKVKCTRPWLGRMAAEGEEETLFGRAYIGRSSEPMICVNSNCE